MKSADVRKNFLSFFDEKKHKIIDSAPIVVKEDPTLMFTNAGMNQFKDVFLGTQKATHKRVANTQKCLRVSGKHNDLDEVGVDTYHHTMFEMLGNWSFGDYFKRDAILWAWELLVDVYCIDKDRLYVTVFEGDVKDGTSKDVESFDIWNEKINQDRIIEFGKKDNFWEMGETGPCGPCSEIHVDIRSKEQRLKEDGSTLVNKDHPEVIELWNLVFVEFNRSSDRSLHSLPHKHVDTGMGFERLCMVLQKKSSNYDTDVFQPIINEVEKITQLKYGTDQEIDIAMRVIADHVRAISFAISDGQLPYRDGAGYVIRRILRRGVRYGYSFLGLKAPFLNLLVGVVVKNLGVQFPELTKQKQLIEKVIREEEETFFRTLERGISKLKDNIGDLSGRFAFELYDTFGFPIDLTSLIANEKGVMVDLEGFQKEMNLQKQRARNAAIVKADDWITLLSGSGDVFKGFEKTELAVRVIRYRKVQAKGKEYYQMVFDQTPFYAESGGQIGDSGVLISNESEITVFDTQKENNVIVHYANSMPKDPSLSFVARVNNTKRLNVTCNHTATHLMHAALQNILGKHVEQRGSLVTNQYLRFDFSHYNQLSGSEIGAIEQEVNEKIKSNCKVNITEMTLQQAKKLGAMALFGEKYGENVRVVSIDNDYSIELCGGTHLGKLKQIGSFKIISESSVAAGIRRVEAVTSELALQKIDDQKIRRNKLLNDLLEASSISARALDLPLGKLTKDDVDSRIVQLDGFLDDISKLQIQEQVKFKKDLLFGMLDTEVIEKEIKSALEAIGKLNKLSELMIKKRILFIKDELKEKVVEKDGYNLLVEQIDVDGGSQKEIVFALKNDIPNLCAMIGGEYNGKAVLTLVLCDEVIASKSYDAAILLRDIAKEIKGGGGGQRFFATAGGPYVAGLPQALTKAKALL